MSAQETNSRQSRDTTKVQLGERVCFVECDLQEHGGAHYRCNNNLKTAASPKVHPSIGGSSPKLETEVYCIAHGQLKIGGHFFQEAHLISQ